MEGSFKEGKGRAGGEKISVHPSSSQPNLGGKCGLKSQTMKNKAENLSETELSIRTMEAKKIKSNKPPRLCSIHPRV